MEHFPLNTPILEEEPRSNIEATREILDALDEEKIQDIFSGVLRKCGNESAIKKFIPLDDFSIISDSHLEDRALYHNGEKKRVTLNAAQLGSDDTSRFFNILHSAIHEESHVLSDKGQKLFQEDHLERIVTEQGLSKTYKLELMPWVREDLLKLFDEGITDLIAEDIVRTYIHQTGSMHSSKLEEYQLWNAGRRIVSGRIAVINTIEEFSEKAGVPFDVVKNALVRFYFNSEEQESFFDWLVSEDELEILTEAATLKNSHFSKEERELKETDTLKYKQLVIEKLTFFLTRNIAE